MPRGLSSSLLFFVGLLGFGASPLASARAHAEASNTKINVMAPLGRIQDWQAFRRQLETLRNHGIQALTTDIWWGEFEGKGDNNFDWSYYLGYAQVVADSGLQWIPILSFHQCGGNIGDDCQIPIPAWVWKMGADADMKFRDEHGFVNNEYVSHFYHPVLKQYAEAMKSFAENFHKFQGIIPKIYLSLGPAGELRYPSYHGPAGWSFPNRGTLQAYSRAGVRDFQRHAYEKFGGDIRALNAAWNTKLKDFSQVNLPTDGDRFFSEGVKTAYGQELMSWYQGRLIRHLQTMFALARANISPSMPELRFGAKMAGVHWLHSSPTMPRAAEYTAGYFRYEEILTALKQADVDLTFTCLEMDDSQKDVAPTYSAPRSILDEVSSIAKRLGIALNGENAIAIVNNPSRYDNIVSALKQHAYSSFTLLRMHNIVAADGNPSAEMSTFQNKVLKQLFTPSAGN